MAHIIIVNRRPGLIRAGVRHPPVAVHATLDFTVEQLRELCDEPELTVVVGDLLTAGMIAELAEADGEAAAGKASKGAKKS
jgi:hypothetical protein